MIKNAAAYQALCEEERWERLAAMSAAETIAIGEALLTSELMALVELPDDDHPVSLARSLGLVR